jgi:holin-like protein
MKYIHQLCIIFGVTFLGEFAHALIPLPIPASIYGLVFMLVFLQTGIIKLEWVNSAGNFLLDIMPVMFLPAAVGLINVWGEISSIAFALIAVTLAVNVIVMVVTGRMTQFVLKARSRAQITIKKEEVTYE